MTQLAAMNDQPVGWSCIWHASHDEFETTSDQLQAHWLIWLGVLFALVIAFVAVRYLRESPARPGYVTVLAGGVAYVVTAGWHFYEHSRGRQPRVPSDLPA